MKFYNPIVHPETESDSLFIEATVGCSHNACAFCKFYKCYPYHAVPLSAIEKNLQEAHLRRPDAKKIWISGGNPFTLDALALKNLVRCIHGYFPKAILSMYARPTDFYGKSTRDLHALKACGVNNIVLRLDSGDDAVLRQINKGFTGKDILHACQKLEASGIRYRVLYLAGLAGARKGESSALQSAALFNQIHPASILIHQLSVLSGTRLYEDMLAGRFQPPSERERLAELRTLVAALRNPIIIDARHSSNYLPFLYELPRDRHRLLTLLTHTLNTFTLSQEHALHARRAQVLSI